MRALRAELGGVMAKQESRRPASLGNVLIVEDDEMVRALAREVLERAGFKVDEASDGLAGVRMLEDPRRSFTVIVSDLGLLGVRGEQVIDHAFKLRPGVPIIVCTGEPIEDHLPAGLTLLRKPFSPKDLVILVKRLAATAPKDELDEWVK